MGRGRWHGGLRRRRLVRRTRIPPWPYGNSLSKNENAPSSQNHFATRGLYSDRGGGCCGCCCCCCCPFEPPDQLVYTSLHWPTTHSLEQNSARPEGDTEPQLGRPHRRDSPPPPQLPLATELVVVVVAPPLLSAVVVMEAFAPPLLGAAAAR